MNFANKNTTLGLLMLVLTISVGLHVIAIVVFGAFKIVESFVREETVFVALTPPPPPPAPPIPQLQQLNRQSSPPPFNPITVDAPDIDLPALAIDINVDNVSAYGRGSGGGFGSGSGSNIREMAITATLFGVEILSEKLGVILDVSNSTHGNIHVVLQEIDKEFDNAIVMLVPGCGLTGSNAEIVPLEEYEEVKEKYNPGGRYGTVPFLTRLFNRNKDFEDIWDELSRQDRGYTVFPVDNDGKPTGGGGAVRAFEFLAEEGVDTIYWFADFQDDLNAEVADDLAGDMRRQRVKVIIHDFVPPLGKRDRGEAFSNILKEMADRTHGKFFLNTLD